jgi:hypothetical protein
MQPLVHGDYSSITNCKTKIPAILHKIFEILSGISKHLSNYSTIPCTTSNAVLRNPGWETLHYVTGKSIKFTSLEIASLPLDIWNSNVLTWLLFIAACQHEMQLTSPVPAESLLHGMELCSCWIVPRFEVLLVVKVMITVLWNVTPHSQEDSNQCFTGTCCI